MKHLASFKLFENFGINTDMEEQATGFMKTIKNSPDKKVFSFVYKCDVGNVFFKVLIDKKLPHHGEYCTVTRDITLQDRNDESTLLHELKHLDYGLRVKKTLNDIYFRANNLTKRIPDIKELWVIFYAFTEDEFQAKYHSYYKDFDKKVSNMVNPSASDIITEFNKFLESHPDKTWSWYFSTKEFKFETYLPASDDRLKILFKKVINPIVDNKDWNSNDDAKGIDIDLTYLSIYNMLKSYWSKLRELLLGKEPIRMSSEDELKMNRNKKMLERNINIKRLKYKKRMMRILKIAIDKYAK